MTSKETLFQALGNLAEVVHLVEADDGKVGPLLERIGHGHSDRRDGDAELGLELPLRGDSVSRPERLRCTCALRRDALSRDAPMIDGPIRQQTMTVPVALA